MRLYSGEVVLEASRGLCRKCGAMGHLTSQCQNKYGMVGEEFGNGDMGVDVSSDSDSDEKKKKKKKSKKV